MDFQIGSWGNYRGNSSYTSLRSAITALTPAIFPTTGSWRQFTPFSSQASRKLSCRLIDQWSLLSNASKILERILKRRVDKHVQEHSIIPQSQFGFRGGTSTEHALFVANSSITKALNYRQTILALKIDTEKAFDAVWTAGLALKMERLGFGVDLILTIFSFTTQRFICSKVNN